MQLVTKRDIIKQVISDWEKAYSSGLYGGDKLEILEKLKKINLNTVSAKKIDSIIGNKSWTSLNCSVCGKHSDKVVVLKDLYDRLGNTCIVYLCLNCVLKINNLFLKDLGKD